MRYAMMAAVALFLVIGIGLMPVFSQDPKGTGEVDMKKLQEDLMKLHTPGKEHEIVRSWAGDYTITGKMWMDPKGEPMEVHGWSKIVTVGEAFVREDFTIVMPGNKKMWGEGIFGYDNDSKTYQVNMVSAWSTTQRIMAGTMDPKTQVLEFKCAYKCPVTHLNVSERVVCTPNKDGTMTIALYQGAEGMGEFKNGELLYTKLE